MKYWFYLERYYDLSPGERRKRIRRIVCKKILRKAYVALERSPGYYITMSSLLT